MPLSIDEFCSRAQASKLLSAEEVRAVLASAAESERPTDGASLATLLVKTGKLTSFQAKRICEGKGASLLLGNYVLLDRIGHGGMGDVFKAEHRRMKRVVALKVVKSELLDTPGALKRFQREVETVAKLDHPNVVTAHDADEANGIHFLVMQFVDGRDLSSLVKNHGPFSVPQAVDCVLQAARGLAYAHEQGIVHRDVKPGNMLLDRKGAVKVLDLGLATLTARDANTNDSLTGSEMIVGTLDYMAPEQAQSPKLADERSDIYSLGMTLWFLLTGRAAYEAETVVAKLLAHQQQPIPSLSESRGDAPAQLDDLFRRMVAKKPEDRPPSMQQVVAALEALQRGQDIAPALARAGNTEMTGEWARTDSGTVRQAAAPTSDGLRTPNVCGSLRDPQAPAELGTGDYTASIIKPHEDTTANMRKPASGVPVIVSTAKRRTRRAGWRQYGLVGVAAALFIIAAVGSPLIMLKLSTPTGSIVVVTDQPESEGAVVSLDGQTKFHAGKSGPQQAIRVTADDQYHALFVTKEGFQPYSRQIRVSDTTAQRVFVRLSPIATAARTPAVAKSVATTSPNSQAPALSPASGGFALEFNGKDSYVDLAALTYDGSSPITIEATVIVHRTDSAATILGDAKSTGIALQCPDARRGVANVIASADDQQYMMAAGSDPVTPNVQLHLAAELDGTKLRLYLDGKLQQESQLSKSFKRGRDRFIIGALPAIDGQSVRRPFPGVIDEVRISKVIRYTTDFTPPTRFGSDADTLALYHFDEGQGEVLTDSSGNSHHGKIVNAKWVPGIAGGPPAANLKSEITNLKSSPPPLAISPFDAAQAKAHQEAWAKHLGVPVEQTNSIGMKLRLIPPGEFLMGSTPEDVAAIVAAAKGVSDSVLQEIRNEAPQRPARIDKPFLAGTTEVTVGQFRQFVESARYVTATEKYGGGYRYDQEQKQHVVDSKLTWKTPGYAVSDDLPVTMVTWDDGVEFCNWLSRQESWEPSYQRVGGNWQLRPAAAGYRLATEAEWEYACRAGTTTWYSFGDDQDRLDDYAWHGRNSGGAVHAAGLKLPNPFGLYDMHGNLWEWCEDRFPDTPSQTHASTDPSGATAGSRRVARGGSWAYWPLINRSAIRVVNYFGSRNEFYGFRVVRTLAAPTSNPKSPIENPKSTYAGGFALEFNGKDSHVDLPTLKYDGSHPITLEASVVVHRLEQGGHVFGGGTLAAGIGLTFPAPSDSRNQSHGIFSHRRPRGPFLLATREPLVPERWMRVAAVLDENSAWLFLDGKLQQRGDFEREGKFVPSDQFLIIGGSQWKPSWFNGLIDEVRISKIVRYKADYTPVDRFEPDKDTLALFHFDEGQGDVLTDASGNGHHGKIVNAKWVPGIAGGPPVKADRRAAEAVLALGGTPTIRIAGDERAIEPGRMLPQDDFELVRIRIYHQPQLTDAELRNVLSGAANVIDLQLTDVPLTDACLESIAPLQKLEILLLNTTQITGAGLSYLRGHEQLKKLGVEGPSVDDRALAGAAGIPHVDLLWLGGTQITDAGLAHLKRMKQLQYLNFGLTQITDAGVAQLKGLTEMRRLVLSGCRVTDASVAYVQDMKKLEELELYDTAVTDAGLAILAAKGPKSIFKLDVEGTAVTDAGLVHLKSLPRLRELSLGRTAVSDEGLVHIKELKTLSELKLNRSKISAGGVEELKRALPQCQVVWTPPGKGKGKKTGPAGAPAAK